MRRKRVNISANDSWQVEEIFNDASVFFERLLNDIHSAKKSIDIDYYIFEFDSLGKKIVDALMDAANRGVAVRLIMDGIGSAESAEQIASLLSTTNAQVRVFHPHPFYPSAYRWSIIQGNALQKFIHFLLYINHRDHHKLCIIDNTYVWTGSFNISAKHLSKKNGGQGWHDYGVRLTDDSIEPVLHCFNSMWGVSKIDDDASHLILRKIRSNLSMSLRQLNNQSLIQRIQDAEKRIWICNAYFAPTHRILKAIKNARSHNVDVRIILPSVSDITMFPVLSRTYYLKLINQGVKIYEYQPGILHAKLILIDDQCMIGSTNMNHRSFYHDLEIDIVLSNQDSITKIEKYLKKDMQDSIKITLDDINRRSILLFFARFLRIFKYWL